MRIFPAETIESRDGGLTKDAQVKNGFIEMHPVPTCFMRPGMIVNKAAAHANGQGLISQSGVTVLRVSNGIIDIAYP